MRSPSRASAAGPTRSSSAGCCSRPPRALAPSSGSSSTVASPLIDIRLFADRAFASANLVSLLTGYTLATAVIGGPVFVNRVLFGTDAESATALTALTLAIAIGALAGGVASGFLGERLVTVLGVAVSAVGLWFAVAWGVETDLGRLVRDLAIFGVGFGLTVSPRATAAVEAAGAGAYGVASAMLQVTRTIGMSVGLALLTSIGQNRIDELSALITDDARRDALVVQLGHSEFVGVDPNASLALVAVLESVVAGRGGRRAGPRLHDRVGGGAGDADPGLVRPRPWTRCPRKRRRSEAYPAGSAITTSSPQLRL